VRREDSSIFIGTGQVSTQARTGEDGSLNMETTYDGPVVEVVVTHDTMIYKDATAPPSGPPSGDQKIQQVVAPGSLDDLGENVHMQVWGERRGDRVVARVVFYSVPFVMAAP
jgi:hypothetical protein